MNEASVRRQVQSISTYALNTRKMCRIIDNVSLVGYDGKAVSG